MKKILLLALAVVFSGRQISAQNAPGKTGNPLNSSPTKPPVLKGTGKITGVIINDAAKKSVEFATISLADKKTGKAIDGTISDDKGRFSVTRIAAGEYTLTISFIGYETKVLDNIAVENGEVNIGAISLKSNARTLGEVAVIGEKALVEDKVDRLVYNAEKDLTNTGGTASEVLKKVPGLTVDLEGNVALRGNSNIRVLINNKPSTVMASSIADALRQIPADLIKSVEVITNPSAKYDAEGTAGIINILTKKNNLQGVNGNLNTSYGTRISSINGNFNYRQGKFGLNTAVGQNWRKNPGKSTRETNYTGLPGIDRLSQKMEGKREGAFQFGQLGLDYELSAKSSLAAGIRMQGGGYAFKTTQLSTQYFNNTVTNANTRVNRNEYDVLNYDINLDYTRQFTKPGQELTLLSLVSRSKRDNYNFADVFNRDTQLTLKEQNLNDAYNEEKTFQADYTHPFKNKQLLEMGAKAIVRYAESDFRFLLAHPATAPFETVANRTDVFAYRQNVAAAYTSYGFTLHKKYNLKLGVRYEYTHIDGDFTTSKTSVRQDYANLIPSVAISRSLKNNQTVKFNYTKRIQRPQLFFLNPFENRSDTFNIQVGNPDLEPELTNSYEFSYSTFFKSGTSVNASVFWRQTNNAIQSYTLPTEAGVNYTRFGNIGQNASYGISLSGSTKFLKKGSVYYTDLASQSSLLNAANASLMYNANLNASYNFNKGISAQVFGDFNSPRVTLQGKSNAWSTYNMAIKKEILHKNGSISAGIDNPFAPTIKQKSTFKTPVADQTNTLYVYVRQFRISAQYKFGKINPKNQPRRKKRITNDDAKSDGDGQ